MLVLCVVQRFGSGKVQNYVFLFYGTVLSVCLTNTGTLLSVGIFADFIIRWIRIKRIRIHRIRNPGVVTITTMIFQLTASMIITIILILLKIIISLFLFFFLLSQNAFFIFTYTFFAMISQNTQCLLFLFHFFNES